MRYRLENGRVSGMEVRRCISRMTGSVVAPTSAPGPVLSVFEASGAESSSGT